MIPEPLEAVIFDMDGVLLDTETLYRDAIFAACAEQGLTMPDHVHLSLIGTPKEGGDAILMSHFGTGFALDRFHQTCTAHFRARCHPLVPVRPGVRQLVAWLRAAGIPRGVATSTGRVTAEAQLGAAGLLDYFDVLVTRTDVVNGKPHPEPFLKAAAALRARPAHCLALEDSHNGVRSAAAAGMVTVMVPDLLPVTAEMRSLCAAVVPDLLDVQRRLQAHRPLTAWSEPATPP